MFARRVEMELQEFVFCAIKLNPVFLSGRYFNGVAVIADIQSRWLVVEDDSRELY